LSLSDIDAATQIVSHHPDLAEFYGPQSERAISATEALLAATLPPSYRHFVRTLGAGSFGAEEILGVASESSVGQGYLDVARVNLANRNRFGFPRNLLIVSELGNGDMFCLDLASRCGDSECPVVRWFHDVPDSSSNFEVLAPDFGSYFLMIVMEEVEAHGPDSSSAGTNE
jgi:hypothetical protein